MITSFVQQCRKGQEHAPAPFLQKEDIMGIHYNKEDKTFTLHTKTSTYQMIVENHRYLLHCYYGSRVEGQNLSYLIQPQDRGFAANPPDANGDRTLSVDTLPQEYSTFGVGDFRESCLDVCNADGSVAADLRYREHRVYKGKKALPGLPASYGTQEQVETLEIELTDSVSGVAATLQYSVFDEYDVITRSVQIVNHGAQTIMLKRALSMCLDDSLPAQKDVITFYGRHMGERNLERTPLRHGKIRIESARGASSPHYNPFVILCDTGTTETMGACCAASLVYSGSFMAQIEMDQTDSSRFVIGINPQTFGWELQPGEAFQTPEVLLCYNEDGLAGMSNKLHRFQLEHLIRGPYKAKRCPVLVNNWEATYFDFDTEKLLSLAKAASEVGIEMLVLDDGWFGNRNDDTRGLGDWFVNTKKLKGGLNYLSRQLHAMGMKFGLWFEPEMVNPDSQLMKTHPEWCLKMPERANVTSRSQCVLNMGLTEVQDYLFDCMAKIIREANLAYIKWDMNRSITNAYSGELPPHRQGEVWHRYILGVYALLERLVQEFPNLLIESCASGGGRYDAGMLYYSPQVWASDNTDAIDRLAIQYGNSFGFPMKTMGSHVSVCPNHQTGRTTPLATRGVVAMAGSFGYEMDLTRLSVEEKEQLRKQIEQFKEQWELHQLGEYHRLTDHNKNRWFVAWQVVSEDRSRSLVTVVVREPNANPPILSVKLRGLEPTAIYIDQQGHQYTGCALMSAGIVLPPMRGDYPAVQIELRKV